jgi:hypothetical protein
MARAFEAARAQQSFRAKKRADGEWHLIVAMSVVTVSHDAS